MRKIFTPLLILLLSATTIFSQDYVVPTSYATTNGTGTFAGPLTSTQRTYQLLINENQLTGLNGKRITGLMFRLHTTASSAWPAADITFSNYDIYLSGSVAPSARSLTFANNVSGPQTQVRSGGLTIKAASLTFGGTPNAFGGLISFVTPYNYSGGHLLVEIRHTGYTGTSTSVNSNLTSTAGYGTNYSACWTGSYTGTAGSQGNFSIINFTSENILPVTLSSFTVTRRQNDAGLEWTTASEFDTKHFEIERSKDGRQFEQMGVVVSRGTSSSPYTYQYYDRNIIAANAPILYYRLKITDNDGSFKYSPIASLNVSKRATKSLLYPNPVKDVITLALSSSENEECNYSILSVEGRVLKTGKSSFIQGNNVLTVDVSQLPAGSYYFNIQGQHTNQQLKFIKE